ncbi:MULTISPECIES: YneF family protein [Paenibacillus]|uniref:YneF family protein n=1 Tax=Paenibacillus TaxID=44249 RepID=UPI00203A5C4A|nr:YneF family protein [Paenibacillus camelliae]MCM3635110.1 YneF family protein [Paenibacillus camelliae]
MAWYDVVIPIVTLVVGLIGGFAIGVFYLRKQIENMQNNPEMMQKQLANMNPEMMQKMAKSMGYNLNSKQMQKAQQMMKNQKKSPRR